MWPAGLIASKASDVNDSLVNNVRPAGSLRSAARTTRLEEDFTTESTEDTNDGGYVMEPRTTLNARKGNGPVDGMRTQCRYAGFVMDRIKRIARMEEEVFAQRSGDAEGRSARWSIVIEDG